MPIFRKGAPRDPLIVAMAGAQMGGRVLVLSARDARMPVDLAAKVGLSGQAVALAPDEGIAAQVEQRAGRQGAFIETGVLRLPLSYDDHTFDVVVADDRTEPTGERTHEAVLAEVLRILRPGGRIVVLQSAPPARWWLSQTSDGQSEAAGAALRARLLAVGFRAARELGVREGIRFSEAARAAG